VEEEQDKAQYKQERVEDKIIKRVRKEWGMSNSRNRAARRPVSCNLGLRECTRQVPH
jgi:hypothetical protein